VRGAREGGSQARAMGGEAPEAPETGSSYTPSGPHIFPQGLDEPVQPPATFSGTNPSTFGEEKKVNQTEAELGTMNPGGAWESPQRYPQPPDVNY